MSRDQQEEITDTTREKIKQRVEYLLNTELQKEIKQLKEDNARWTCKHTAAEQKYQTQSNVIAELRKRAENWRIEAESWRTEAFRKYPTPDAYEATCAALEKHRERADKAEEREQKLKEAYERTYKSIYANHATMNHMENTEHEKGQISGLIQASNILERAFATLNPLDREEEHD